MLLRGEDYELELKVAGYQFPRHHEPYDADWLNISVRVRHPRGSWSATDPCMLTWELAELAEWLRRVAGGEPAEAKQVFMEPELRFAVLDGEPRRLRVYFEYNFRPAWSPYLGPDEEEELWVEFEVGPEELRRAADSLSAEARRFHVRVPGFS